MSRGDSPEDIGDFEVIIDWAVCDGLLNGLEPEEMQEILDDYRESLDKDRFVEKHSES